MSRIAAPCGSAWSSSPPASWYRRPASCRICRALAAAKPSCTSRPSVRPGRIYPTPRRSPRARAQSAAPGRAGGPARLERAPRALLCDRRAMGPTCHGWRLDRRRHAGTAAGLVLQSTTGSVPASVLHHPIRQPATSLETAGDDAGAQPTPRRLVWLRPGGYHHP